MDEWNLKKIALRWLCFKEILQKKTVKKTLALLFPSSSFECFVNRNVICIINSTFINNSMLTFLFELQLSWRSSSAALQLLFVPHTPHVWWLFLPESNTFYSLPISKLSSAVFFLQQYSYIFVSPPCFSFLSYFVVLPAFLEVDPHFCAYIKEYSTAWKVSKYGVQILVSSRGLQEMLQLPHRDLSLNLIILTWRKQIQVKFFFQFVQFLSNRIQIGT